MSERVLYAVCGVVAWECAKYLVGVVFATVTPSKGAKVRV